MARVHVAAVQWGKWRYCAAAVLLLVAAAYHVKGYAHLLGHPRATVDLRARWQEYHSIESGTTWSANQLPEDWGVALSQYTGEGHRYWAKAARLPSSGGYPPWSFFAGNLLYWPDWPQVRWYFAGLNLLATVGLSFWVFRVFRSEDLSSAVLAVAAVLAINGFCRTLVLGQMGILCTALLAATPALMRNRWNELGRGVALGIAMSKPSLALPFMLPLILSGRKWLLAGLACYLTVATWMVALVSGADPWEMLAVMMQAGVKSADRGTGALPQIVALGVSPQTAAYGIAFVALGIGVAFMVFLRHNILAMYAVAALVARLWTYHNANDDVVLLFLLIALLLMAVQRPSVPVASAVLLLGASLWMPQRCLSLPGFPTFQITAWLFGTAVVVYGASKDRQHSGRVDARAG